MKILKNALVITPTVYSKHLPDAIASVASQTHHATDMLCVLDGVSESDFPYNFDFSVYIMELPWNVGKDGGSWYGHRVYASIPKLIPEKYEYVFFLDEDNTFEPNHIESCINAIEQNDRLDCVHSLRRIVDKDGKFLINDDCESLGRYPIMGQIGHHLIDTSSYCFKRQFIRDTCHLWDSGWGGDRRYLANIINKMGWDNVGQTGEYTLNYRLDGNDGSVSEEFFEIGNKKTREDRPWAVKF